MPIPDRWIPMTWGWLWRTKYALLGKPTVLQLNPQVVTLAAAAKPLLWELLKTRTPLAETNGVRGWVIPDGEINSLLEALKQSGDCAFLDSPRITTSHRVHTRIASTAPSWIDGVSIPVGLTAEFFPAVRGKAIELTAVLSYSEKVKVGRVPSIIGSLKVSTFMIQTNLAVAVKLCLPQGHGAFLVQSNDQNEMLKAVWISVSTQSGR
jgi:hypothetical protein